MKQIFIVGNWKSNKTALEATEWLEMVKNQGLSLREDQKVVLCVPFTLLQLVSSFVKENNLQIAVGAQDISQFDEGSFTGATNGKQIAEFATYVIIGHSERRMHFGEIDEVLAMKFDMARKYALTPIYLVQDKDTVIPEGISIVGYEPVFAIGTGIPDTPENANAVAKEIKTRHAGVSVLYGGSVTSVNVSKFTQLSDIDGVIPGKASLNPQEFLQLIKNA